MVREAVGGAPDARAQAAGRDSSARRDSKGCEASRERVLDLDEALAAEAGAADPQVARRRRRRRSRSRPRRLGGEVGREALAGPAGVESNCRAAAVTRPARQVDLHLAPARPGARASRAAGAGAARMASASGAPATPARERA